MAMACLLLIISCKDAGEKNVAEIVYKGDTVMVDTSSPILTKIKTEVLKEEPFCSEFRTVGTIQAETGNYAEVGVPFDGRITSAKVMLGSHVRAGQTLLEVSSPEFFEASKLYFQNLRLYETAQSAYQRKKALQESGVVSQRELEEAFATAEAALQEKTAAEAAFKAYGMNPAHLELGQAMPIVAPISGEVVRCNITPGTFAKADGEAIVTIADLSKVWIMAQVKERFIGAVSHGGKVEIFTEADSGNPILGSVLHIGNLVDDQTRSVQVIVACDNADQRLKHGMYVSVHFITETKEAIVVPATAIFQGEKTCYVYMASETKNTFVRREVTVGESDGNNAKVHVLNGLCSSETIVSEGGLYLNN